MPAATPTLGSGGDKSQDTSLVIDDGQDDDEEGQEGILLRNTTIKTADLACFEVNSDLYKAFSSYRLRTRTKRSTVNARVSSIFAHGVELEEQQDDGEYHGR